MSEPPLAREEWHSSPSEVSHCLFCGVAGRTWFNRGENELGCSCFEARRVREKKSEFKLLRRDGEDVIVACSPDLWPALVRAGWLGPMGIRVLTRELSAESVAALKAAQAAIRMEMERRGLLDVTKSSEVESEKAPDFTRDERNLPAQASGNGADERKSERQSPVCQLCGKVIEVAGAGRRPRFCSRSCQQKAYRARV